MAKLLRQMGRGKGEVRLDWGISSWLKAFVFPHPRHIKHLTTCRRLIDFTALLQTSCRSSAPRSSLTHPATIFEQAQPSIPVLLPRTRRGYGSVRLSPFLQLQITFKLYDFDKRDIQKFPISSCAALQVRRLTLPPFPRHPCAARFWFLLPKTSR